MYTCIRMFAWYIITTHVANLKQSPQYHDCHLRWTGKMVLMNNDVTQYLVGSKSQVVK